MQTVVLDDEAAVAQAAARWIATAARQAIAERGQFLLAVSGGKTPWLMLQELAQEELPWSGVHLFQVDERVAPDGHPDRNLTQLMQSLAAADSLNPLGTLPINIHPMPVTEPHLPAAAQQYAAELARWAGQPPVLDVVHLGLGTDGHTASLVPGDDCLNVTSTDVAITGVYQGRQRMTLTYPLLNRARQVLWLATGAGKREMLPRLLNSDPTIPAGLVRADTALLMTDRAAVG